MKLELDFAELHNSLFLGGTNWGLKLQPHMGTKGRLELAYDREEKELLVSTGKHVAIIPTSNVASMTPKTVKEASKSPVIEPIPAPARKPGRPSAQVSGPTDHVFKGVGAGKTND